MHECPSARMKRVEAAQRVALAKSRWRGPEPLAKRMGKAVQAMVTDRSRRLIPAAAQSAPAPATPGAAVCAAPPVPPVGARNRRCRWNRPIAPLPPAHPATDRRRTVMAMVRHPQDAAFGGAGAWYVGHRSLSFAGLTAPCVTDRCDKSCQLAGSHRRQTARPSPAERHFSSHDHAQPWQFCESGCHRLWPCNGRQRGHRR